jgi:hypothetical protein
VWWQKKAIRPARLEEGGQFAQREVPYFYQQRYGSFNV